MVDRLRIPASLRTSLVTMFSELVHGTPADQCYILNPGDAGLLKSLDALPADAASRSSATGGASIAAHVDHVCYGLELLVRWSAGEPNPWRTADWSVSWRRTTVSEAEWEALRTRLREAAAQWQVALESDREVVQLELNGIVSSVAHLAYHVGAVRQIDRALQGPRAEPPGER